jgi:hypothetical protein
MTLIDDLVGPSILHLGGASGTGTGSGIFFSFSRRYFDIIQGDYPNRLNRDQVMVLTSFSRLHLLDKVSVEFFLKTKAYLLYSYSK